MPWIQCQQCGRKVAPQATVCRWCGAASHRKRSGGSGAFFMLAVVAVVGAFLLQSYRHKLEGVVLAGMTTELSGLVTYVVGALVSHQQYWVATTLTVLAVALLELKTALEGEDTEAISAAASKVATSSQAMGSAMYAAEGATASADAGGGSAEADDDSIVDAEIVDEPTSEEDDK